MHQQVTSPPGTVTPGPPVAGVVSPRRRKSRRRRKILIGIGAVLLLWIIGAIINSKREKPIPVTTDKATRRTIVQIVSATGKIQPETEVKISPEVAGEIIELPVDDGIAVKKGDLLVKIKPDSYKALVEQQEAAEIGVTQRGLGALEPIGTEAVEVDPLLPVDRHGGAA